MNPKVIVLILSYNGKHLLDDSISSYLSNDYPNFEVIVIDNGSSDGTKEYVENNFPKAKVLRTGTNLKYSGGFNLGLDYAFNKCDADFVLISNNDVKVDSKVISELVKVAVTNDKIGFVTGKVYFFDQQDVLQTVGKKEDPVLWNGGHIGNKEKDTGQFDAVCERFFADDIFTLTSKKLYKEIGGYDNAFAFQSEEYDWQARAKLAGYKIMYTPYAKIWHKVSATIGKASAFKLYYDARNPFIVVMKYKSPQFIKRYLKNHFKDVLLTSLVNLKRLKFDVVISVWKGFASAVIWGIKNKKLTLMQRL
jgi:hypothetical protein